MKQAIRLCQNYEDKGKNISEDVVITGNIGEKYTTEQKVIEGYVFKEVQGTPSGQFTDRDQTVTYIYTKNVTPVVETGRVITKVVDDQGKKIHEDVTASCKVRDDYKTNSLDISGYTLEQSKLPKNVTGQYTKAIQTVTYVYTKNNVIPIPKPDNHLDTSESSKDNGKKNDPTSENKNTLPQTGDNEGLSMIGIISGLFLILGTIVMILFKRNRQD
ncbi:LPXTG cell wall anchor domain-containing protein [Lactococcus lactis]|uniref:MucBP domain-containing protein n=1 Tax=Lactococcus lactis TaxID=1358 RepID=UPI0021A68ACF|nr:MucBP domain-containing protein [Lactococcus lactis]MCT3091813.1 LPXTG cell wall anchor domain-containing protein [Lactococcus lactis]